MRIDFRSGSRHFTPPPAFPQTFSPEIPPRHFPPHISPPNIPSISQICKQITNWQTQKSPLHEKKIAKRHPLGKKRLPVEIKTQQKDPHTKKK